MYLDIIEYENDLPLYDFADLIKEPTLKIRNEFDYFEPTVFGFDTPKIDYLKNPIIDFNMASLLLMAVGRRNSSLHKNIILKRGNILSTKKVEDINIGESIKLDGKLSTYSFIKKFNKNLKCITGKHSSKIFQMDWPFLLFEVDNYTNVFYYKGSYYLNDESYLKVLNVHPGLYFDDYDDDYPELDKGFDINDYAESFEKARILIADVESHKDEYEDPSYPIEDMIASMKEYPYDIFESEELCEDCGSPLYQFHFCSPRETREGLCGRAGDMLICPHCKKDYGIVGGFVMN